MRSTSSDDVAIRVINIDDRHGARQEFVELDSFVVAQLSLVRRVSLTLAAK